MIAVGQSVQVQRSSGKMEWGWTVKAILPGYMALGIHRSVVLVADWDGQEIKKTVDYPTVEKWQTFAVCDTMENLTTRERPS